MPAVTVENPLVLPRLSQIATASGVPGPAIDDYEKGKLGIIPADQLAPRKFA